MRHSPLSARTPLPAIRPRAVVAAVPAAAAALPPVTALVAQGRRDQGAPVRRLATGSGGHASQPRPKDLEVFDEDLQEVA